MDDTDLNHFLNNHFEKKHLGFLSYFLGLKISFDSTGYYLSQAKYAYDARPYLIDSKATSTSLEPNAHLTPLEVTP